MESRFVTQVIPEALPASTPTEREHRVDLLLEAFWSRPIWVFLLLGLLVDNGFLQLKKRVVGELQFQPTKTREFTSLRRWYEGVFLLLGLLIDNGFLQLKKRVVGELQFQPTKTREFTSLRRWHEHTSGD